MPRPRARPRPPEAPRRYPLGDLARAMTHPAAVAVGEVTRWPDAWAGRPEMLKRLALAHGPGRRVEGHTAGAKAEKIAAIAAAGFTSDHEPITAPQVLERARQGISVMLRESSLRPDLAGLLDALKAAPALVSRLMLTCDGSMPAFILANGFMDHALRLALDRGVPPIDAYRMATLNAATYYGLDADLGAVAPGRYADVCVLRDLAEPRPEMVIAGGRVAADRGEMLARMPEVPWQRAFTSAEARLNVRWRARAEDFALPPRDRYPVARLVSAVITRLEERPLAPGDLHAALVDRRGRWVAPAVVAGFAGGSPLRPAATVTTHLNIFLPRRGPAAAAPPARRP